MATLIDSILDSFVRTLMKFKSNTQSGEYVFADLVAAYTYLTEEVKNANVRILALEERCSSMNDIEKLESYKTVLMQLGVVADNLLATPTDDLGRPQVLSSDVLFQGVEKGLIREVVCAYEKVSLENIMKVALEVKQEYQLAQPAFKQCIGYLLYESGIPSDKAIEFIELHGLAKCSSKKSYTSTMRGWRVAFEDNYPDIFPSLKKARFMKD